MMDKAVIKDYIDAFNLCDRDPGKDSRDIPNDNVWYWLHDNVPLVELPDKTIERVYYFRWWTYRKHLRRTIDGFVVSEFLKDVPWAGKHNSISCAAGHHIYEGRWLRNQVYMDDYLRFWFTGGGSVRSYSFWAADAAYNRYLVNGDLGFLAELFPYLEANYGAWEQEKHDDSGLYWQEDDREGMELSIGGTGLRPNINSYMYADAKALSCIAALLGDAGKSRQYAEKSETIKALFIRLLWDGKAGFFKTLVTEKTHEIQRLKYSDDNGYAGQALGLTEMVELFGYTPWYFGLPGRQHDCAWKYLMNPVFFNGEKGLATAPISHPDFMRPHHHECAWDGPSWPFSTYQTLGGLARRLQEGACEYINKEDFTAQLHKYAAAHVDRDVPWIDENYHPTTGAWIARDRLEEWEDPNRDRGMYYNHSGFCDLVLSGLLGIRPEEERLTIRPLIPDDWDYFHIENLWWRGKRLDIRFDRTGRHYGGEAGITVCMEGRRVELPYSSLLR
jgi:hypothetical protein